MSEDYIQHSSQNSSPENGPFYLVQSQTTFYLVIFTNPTSKMIEGLRAPRFFLDQRPESSPPTTTLLRLAELILTFNNFTFNSSYFLQVRGVAMGTCMDPSYACFFM
eukprot:g30299.t1